MNLLLKRYLRLTERTVTSVARETGLSRQRLEWMLKTDAPVFVECSPDDDYQVITELYKREVFYVNGQNLI